MKEKGLIPLTLLFMAFVPILAFPQVPSRPKKVTGYVLKDSAVTLGMLSDYYYEGRWTTLQESVKKIIDGCSFTKINTSEKYQIREKQNYYSVVFIGSGETGKAHLLRFLWHDPAPEPYSTIIPGVKTLHEIVLSDARAVVDLKSSYLSSEVDNPLLAQVPKFVEKLEPILVAATSYRGALGLAQDIRIEVREVALPYRRAKIEIKDVAVLNDAAAAAALKKEASSLRDYLLLRGVYKSDFGQKLTETLAQTIDDLDFSKGDGGLLEKGEKAVRLAFEDCVRQNKPSSKDLKLAMDVEQRFLEMVNRAAPKEISGEADYNNLPQERFSFGLVSAVMFRNSFFKERTKLTDSGRYAVDPLRNPLAAAIVNIHPFSYNSKSSKPSLAEMFRFFVGGVLSPDYGLCGGVGFSFLRGLSLNGGVALLGSDVPKKPQAVFENGKETGTKPADPNDPFKTKFGAVLFLGFGYSF